jgi:Cu/Ag efflux pump CusA
MTSLSLRNPIAILMICVGLVVFAGVVTPRMSVDTFPELTPPVLIMQTEGRDLGSVAGDLERALRADPRTRDVPFESSARSSSCARPSPA